MSEGFTARGLLHTQKAQTLGKCLAKKKKKKKFFCVTAMLNDAERVVSTQTI